MKAKKDIYQTSRTLYIIEAALEYFISILIADSYLAKIATSAGLSDTLTYLLTSFTSLACSFQMVAIFLASRRPVKRWVTPLHILNQTLFALFYLVPGINLSTEMKGLLFVVFLLMGHIISQVVYASKINWFMSLVDDNKRGRFTANKEIISLMSGLVFSLIMGQIIDRFEAAGNLNGAFVLVGATIFVLMLGHTATLIFSKEKEVETAPVPIKKELLVFSKEKEVETAPVPIKKELRSLLGNKTLYLVIAEAVLWSIAHSCVTPFLGAYRNNVLGFSMTYNAILSALYAIVRSLVSRPLGKFADKHSFATMLILCFGIVAVAFGINVFTVPENGHVLFAIYYMLYGVAIAGINSGAINLIYDYVEPSQRTSALAIRGTLAGLVGFGTSSLLTIPEKYITNKGNMLFGIHAYPQQIFSVLGVIFTVILILYMVFVVRKIKRHK